jgi:hypothetical protein
VTDREDQQEIAHLHDLNDQLSASLDRCRSLLDECRSKLAANSNDKEPADGNDGKDKVVQRTR